jgi:cytochrome oxidase Cu insertion factor (SCO1/SenC/PrrC family)
VNPLILRVAALAGLLLAAGVLVFLATKPPWVMRAVEPGGARVPMTPRPVRDFKLTDSEGRLFHSADLYGQVWIVSFFFSTCPATCREQNEIARRLSRQWGRQGVKVLSITCDPEIDTPERLREYAEACEADPDQWFFLTGPMDQISRIGQENFLLHVGRRSHSDRFAAVDRASRLRGIYDWHDPAQLEALNEQLKELVLEESPTDGSPDRADEGDQSRS